MELEKLKDENKVLRQLVGAAESGWREALLICGTLKGAAAKRAEIRLDNTNNSNNNSIIDQNSQSLHLEDTLRIKSLEMEVDLYRRRLTQRLDIMKEYYGSMRNKIGILHASSSHILSIIAPLAKYDHDLINMEMNSNQSLEDYVNLDSSVDTGKDEREIHLINFDKIIEITEIITKSLRNTEHHHLKKKVVHKHHDHSDDERSKVYGHASSHDEVYHGHYVNKVIVHDNKVEYVKEFQPRYVSAVVEHDSPLLTNDSARDEQIHDFNDYEEAMHGPEDDLVNLSQSTDPQMPLGIGNADDVKVAAAASKKIVKKLSASKKVSPTIRNSSAVKSVGKTTATSSIKSASSKIASKSISGKATASSVRNKSLISSTKSTVSSRPTTSSSSATTKIKSKRL